jgi:hypothetical protein
VILPCPTGGTATHYTDILRAALVACIALDCEISYLLGEKRKHSTFACQSVAGMDPERSSVKSWGGDNPACFFKKKGFLGSNIVESNVELAFRPLLPRSRLSVQ